MSEYAVRLHGAGKRYKIFDHRRDHLFDAFGFTKVLPWIKTQHEDFWALRHIDLDLRKGDRIGIIGRNGAGKTTMLKLITGNLPPTEGTVEVEGEVHALLDVSGGFHPEFTGRENVRGALTYQGLTMKEIREVEKDIAEFTDLGRYFDQPFKTYSLGMQARLTFACATVFTPDVLIVDEVLGAGDAAFYRRSTERMRELMNSGAAVLLVSHAMQQIQRFCDEAIWLERGQIVMRGSTTEVVKAYDKFTRELDEQWLQEQRREHSRGRGDRRRFDEPSQTAMSEWKDLQGLRITNVVMEGEGGKPQSQFRVGGAYRIRIHAEAEAEGTFPVTPVALIFRPDGIIVTRHVAETKHLDLEPGDDVEAVLDFGSLQLGNGEYFLSAGMWAHVDPTHIEPSNYYHHYDRSFPFKVTGNPPMHDEMFVHPASWRFGKVVASPGAHERLGGNID
jgi:homopolymeric O-antigen transport system ATP-binding protein